MCKHKTCTWDSLLRALGPDYIQSCRWPEQRIICGTPSIFGKAKIQRWTASIDDDRLDTDTGHTEMIVRRRFRIYLVDDDGASEAYFGDEDALDVDSLGTDGQDGTGGDQPGSKTCMLQ